jgi:hypothetical protein
MSPHTSQPQEGGSGSAAPIIPPAEGVTGSASIEDAGSAAIEEDGLAGIQEDGPAAIEDDASVAPTRLVAAKLSQVVGQEAAH